jgi:hypothetical protein
MHNHETQIAAEVAEIHRLYGQLTGQQLTLHFGRQRLWFEFLRAGFRPQDLEHVVRYLQKEIRAGRRNVGALKVSNLLQLDRFEEDLNLLHIRLRPPPPHVPPSSSRSEGRPSLSGAEEQRLRQHAVTGFQLLREQLRRAPDP